MIFSIIYHVGFGAVRKALNNVFQRDTAMLAFELKPNSL